MRYRSDHKADTRQKILAIAAGDIRARGPAAVSVADVMKQAGLTHGGFYAHFASKDALVADAIGAMFADARRNTAALDAALDGAGADLRAAFAAYLTGYLSRRHRDAPESGCPLPALSADISRAGGAAQARFAEGMARVSGRIAKVLARLEVADPDTQAVAVTAQMVGALALARAQGSGAASDATLAACRDDLVHRFAL